MILYAVAALFSPIFGQIATKFTIVPVFIFYWILTAATGIFMLFWHADPTKTYMLFILAVMLGIIESINTPQPRGILYLENYTIIHL